MHDVHMDELYCLIIYVYVKSIASFGASNNNGTSRQELNYVLALGGCKEFPITMLCNYTTLLISYLFAGIRVLGQVCL